ncbi:hypothetical protein ACIQ9E_12815 [Streptomyces sp. NPDC094448]|uniref:hypothetical protein n=1 Tax=Streptomyces sp. NPDC094448 TaxID=3366063 RepID=UPI0037F7DF68
MRARGSRPWQVITAGLSAAFALLLVLGITAKDRILQSVDGAFLNVVDDCATTGPLEREIDALPFFTTPPPGAVPARGFEAPGGEAGCLDDSGDELVTAYRTYRLTGDKQAVADRFRAVAERDGWQRGPVEADPDLPDVPVDPADLCFEKRLENGPVMVTVVFLPARKQVEVDAYAMLDGTATAC